MAQRDYASRAGSNKKKKANGGNKTLLLSIVALVIGAFAGGLYFLKQQTPDTATQVNKAEKTQPKRQLPSRPEEQWSYIKELESRTVLTDEKQTEKAFRLTEKQKEDLRLLEEKEKQAVAERLKRAEEQKQAEEKKQAELNALIASKTTEESLKEQDEAELKAAQLAAEKRKREEDAKRELDRKREEERKKAELAKKEEQAKREQAKKEESKKVETAKPTNTGQFGLQCGAFKNRAQAENLQARLAMVGLNARVNVSTDWNRVVVGPMGDRNAAAKAQQQASSVTGCVIIGM